MLARNDCQFLCLSKWLKCDGAQSWMRHWLVCSPHMYWGPQQICQVVSVSLFMCLCVCMRACARACLFSGCDTDFSGEMIKDGSSKALVLPLLRSSWAEDLTCVPNLERQVRQPPSLPYRKESFGRGWFPLLFLSRGPEKWEAEMRISQLRCQEASGCRPPGNLGSAKIECSISWVWCWGKDVDSSKGQLACSSWSPVPA